MKSWVITKKDLTLLCRDKRALVVLVMLPLVFITIIGLTTGKLMGWSDSNKIIKIALYDNIDYDNIGTIGSFEMDEIGDPDAVPLNVEEADEDDGMYDAEDRKQMRTEARNLVMKIANRVQEKKGLKIIEVKSQEDADKLVADDEANSSLTIGPKFYQRYYHLEFGDFLISKEGRLKDGILNSLDMTMDCKQPDSGTFSITKELISLFAFKSIAPGISFKTNAIKSRVSSTIKEKNINKTDNLIEDPIEKLAEENKAEPIALIEYVQPETDSKGSDVYQDLIPSYTVLFTFFLVNIMARSFIHEREIGTLKRLQIAPIRPASLLAGKTIPFLIISLLQSFLLFSCGKFLFQMSWGNQPYFLLPVIFCTSMAATSLGLLVATFVRTESQVSATANLVVITMAGMSGCFMPRKWLPPEMQNFSLLFPHSWALNAYNQLLAQRVPDLKEVTVCCAALAGFAMFYFIVGSIRFEKVT